MNALDEAISLMGGCSRAAAELGVVQSAVSNWRARGRAPAAHCLAIERATDGAVTRYELRPDVFGPAPVEKVA